MRDHIGDDNNMVTDAGWTAEKPTAAGWYWLIENGWSEPEVVQVKEVGILWRVYFSSGRRDDLKFVDGEWLGPITPDSYQQGRVAAFRQGIEKLREREKFYTEQEAISQGQMRLTRGLQRNESSGCIRELEKLAQQAQEGEAKRLEGLQAKLERGRGGKG